MTDKLTSHERLVLRNLRATGWQLPDWTGASTKKLRDLESRGLVCFDTPPLRGNVKHVGLTSKAHSLLDR